MLRVYYSANIVPQGLGSGNFSIDLWNNAKALRRQAHYILEHFDGKLTLYSPYMEDMFVRMWETEIVSSGEISQFNEGILDMCDILLVSTDPDSSGEVKNDIENAIAFGITVVYLYQHKNLEDKLIELRDVIDKLDVKKSED